MIKFSSLFISIPLPIIIRKLILRITLVFPYHRIIIFWKSWSNRKCNQKIRNPVVVKICWSNWAIWKYWNHTVAVNKIIIYEGYYTRTFIHTSLTLFGTHWEQNHKGKYSKLTRTFVHQQRKSCLLLRKEYHELHLSSHRPLLELLVCPCQSDLAF